MSLELRFTLPNQPPQIAPIIEARTLMGTLMSNEIVLRASGVEPIHAMIEIMDDGVIILTDLGSRSGVMLNGNKVDVEAPLKAGDKLLVGTVSLEVLPLAPAAASKALSALIVTDHPLDDEDTPPPPPAGGTKRMIRNTTGAPTVRRNLAAERRDEKVDILFSPRKARPSGNVLEVVSYWADTILDVELFHPKFRGYERATIGDPTKAHFLAGGNTDISSHELVRFKEDGYRIRMLPDMEGRFRRGGKVEEVKGHGSIDMGRRDIAHIRHGAVRFFIMFVTPPPMDLPRNRARDPLFAALLSLAMLLYLVAVPLIWMTKPKAKDTLDDDAWTTVNVPVKLDKPKPEEKKPEPKKPEPPKPEQKVVEKKVPPPPKPPVPKPPPPKPAEPVAKPKPQQQKPTEKPAEVPQEKPVAELKQEPLKPVLKPVPPVPQPKPAVEPPKQQANQGMASANNAAKADMKKPGPPTKSNDVKTGGEKGSGNNQRGGERKGKAAISAMGVEGPKNDKPSGVNLGKLGLGVGKILDKTGPGAIATDMKSSAGGAGGGSGSGAKTLGLGGIGGSGSLGLAGAAGEINNFGSGSGGAGSGQGGLGGMGGNGIGQGFGSGNGRGRANVEVPPGDPVVSGGLTTQEVQAVIRANLNQIRHCYEQLLQRSPSASGKIKVQFVVGVNGRVSSASILSTTINDPVMGGCISGAVQRWAFPKPRGGQPVTVSYPFVFNPV